MSGLEQDATAGNTSKRGVIIAIVALVAALALALLAYNVLAGGSQAGNSGTQVATSSSAALSADALMLSDFDATVYSDLGDATPLTKLSDGRPLVINFWTTWCPYCMDEMPDFQAIYDDYADRVSFAFVDGTDGARETIEDAKAWVDNSGYTLPFYYDTKRQAVMAFGVSSYPTTVVVSSEGEILAIADGRIDADKMRAALDSLL